MSMMNRKIRRALLLLLLILSVGVFLWGLLPTDRALEVVPLGPELKIPTPTGALLYTFALV